MVQDVKFFYLYCQVPGTSKVPGTYTLKKPRG